MTPLLSRAVGTHKLVARALGGGALLIVVGIAAAVGVFATRTCGCRDVVPAVAVADEPTAPVESSTLVLELDVTRSSEGCMYYSTWDVKAVAVEAGTQNASFERDFSFMDGCEWRAMETLVAVAPGRYAYSYTETPVSCRPHHTAAQPCTRSGFAVAR